MRLLRFLNENAGAIQAVSTVVLVAITWWYARLTQRLAQTAREQLAESRTVRQEQVGEKRAIIRAQLLRLVEALASVPEGQLFRVKEASEILTGFDEYQREFARTSVGMPKELRQDIEIISGALRSIKTQAERTKSMKVNLDDAVYNADLPLINLREATARAVKYLSNQSAEDDNV